MSVNKLREVSINKCDRNAKKVMDMTAPAAAMSPLDKKSWATMAFIDATKSVSFEWRTDIHDLKTYQRAHDVQELPCLARSLLCGAAYNMKRKS